MLLLLCDAVDTQKYMCWCINVGGLGGIADQFACAFGSGCLGGCAMLMRCEVAVQRRCAAARAAIYLVAVDSPD